jgi:hypothetical protein
MYSIQKLSSMVKDIKKNQMAVSPGCPQDILAPPITTPSSRSWKCVGHMGASTVMQQDNAVCEFTKTLVLDLSKFTRHFVLDLSTSF